MVWTEQRPITGQVIEVVHDDGYKQVEDLEWEKKGTCEERGFSFCLNMNIPYEHATASHQEGTETVEAEEVEDGKVGPASVLFSWQEVGLGVTLLPVH